MDLGAMAMKEYSLFPKAGASASDGLIYPRDAASVFYSPSQVGFISFKKNLHKTQEK